MSIIANEFKYSMLRSIEKYSKQIGCDEKNVQIAFELDGNENVYKIARDFVCIEEVKLNDILFLNPVYSMFKWKIPGTLNKCLRDLSKEIGDRFTVYVEKSNTDVRVMLSANGKHVKDISIENFIKL